ncbi:MAG: hypothetical protein JNL08_17050 [Planctomycetes bacterium]|nr:hypothetical protein [Planctomycetota bacterium]
MPLRTELAATVLGFVLLNLLLVFTAIGLFGRMGPAIDRILQRNDASIGAAEEVLEALARSGDGAVDAAETGRIRAALDRARGNLTEAGEQPALEAVERELPAALAGDAAARQALVARVHDLIAINRAAMRDVDRDAQRLGKAGAWAAALVGLLSLALSLFLTRSLGQRVVLPVLELRDTLRAVRAGDRFRRCMARRASPELQQALEQVNDLLDRTAPAIELDAGDTARR